MLMIQLFAFVVCADCEGSDGCIMGKCQKMAASSHRVVADLSRRGAPKDPDFNK
jgi:hypothetical protein